MHPSRLMTATLRAAPWGESAARILSAALDAADPHQAVARFLHRQANTLTVEGRAYPLDQFRRVYVVGAGKAGLPMAQAAVEILGDRLTAGSVVVKEGYGEQTPAAGPVAILEAGHPLPDARGLHAAQSIADLLTETQPDDLVIGLISGGGSALLTLPVPGVSLDGLRALTVALLASGATIEEINTLRKRLSQVKGGGLARLAAPAQMVTLILSDVVGDPLDMIASGPTVPNPDTFSDALTLVQKYNLTDHIPPSLYQIWQTQVTREQTEPLAPPPPFDHVQNVLVGNNAQSAKAALFQAEREGYHPLLLTTTLQGEARLAGRNLAALSRQLAARGPRPFCAVAGGETTVTLHGDGLGGRNQELALAAVRPLSGQKNLALLTLATDGGDGPTNAAGAVVTGETLSRAEGMGLDPDDYLARNDSYHFFEALGDLLIPGPTMTNVGDLVVVLSIEFK